MLFVIEGECWGENSYTSGSIIIDFLVSNSEAMIMGYGLELPNMGSSTLSLTKDKMLTGVCLSGR